MKTQPSRSTRAARRLLGGLLTLLAATTTAQTAGSVTELRQTLKSELAPLSLSIKQQAVAVTKDLVATVVAELADGLKSWAPGAQATRREVAGAERDRS